MIYYAHSKKIYGTKRETKELNFLETFFKKVLCPNRDMGELGDIEPYLKKVRKAELIIVSTYKNHVGKGCFCEVNEALKRATPVLMLSKKGQNFCFKPVIGVVVYDETDWKIKYGILKCNDNRN